MLNNSLVLQIKVLSLHHVKHLKTFKMKTLLIILGIILCVVGYYILGGIIIIVTLLKVK